MDLRQLTHFIAAVECGNLSQASRKVFLSQPALSRSIQALEDLLDTKLLERLVRGVVPTPAGQAFYRDAKFILNEWDNVRQSLISHKSGKVGTVDIGIVPMFATHIVPEFLGRTTTTLTEVEIFITEGATPELIDHLQEGRLDLVFTNLLPPKLPRGLTAERLWTVSSVVAVGKGNPLAAKRKPSEDDIVGAKWVLGRNMRELAGIGAYVVEQHLSENGLSPPKSLIQTTSLPLLKELVLHHGFVSMLPAHIIKTELARGDIKEIPLKTGAYQRPAGLVYRDHGRRNALIDRVLAVFRAVAQETPTR